MILASSSLQVTGKAFGLFTKGTLGINSRRCILCSSNSLGILFGFRKVNGDIQLAVGGIRHPFLVFFYPIAANIVGILGKIIEKVGSFPGILLIKCPETVGNPRGSGGQKSHNAGIKKIPVSNRIIRQKAARGSIVQKGGEQLLERVVSRYHFACVIAL